MLTYRRLKGIARVCRLNKYPPCRLYLFKRKIVAPALPPAPAPATTRIIVILPTTEVSSQTASPRSLHSISSHFNLGRVKCSSSNECRCTTATLFSSYYAAIQERFPCKPEPTPAPLGSRDDMKLLVAWNTRLNMTSTTKITSGKVRLPQVHTKICR